MLIALSDTAVFLDGCATATADYLEIKLSVTGKILNYFLSVFTVSFNYLVDDLLQISLKQMK